MSLSFLRRMVCTNDIATPFEFEREVAFSREPHQPKQYVQNLVTRDAAKIYDTWIKWDTENITFIYSQPLNISMAGEAAMCTSAARSPWQRGWRPR